MKRSVIIPAALLGVLLISSSCTHHNRFRKEYWHRMPRMERFGMMKGMRHGNFGGPQWGGNFRPGPGYGPWGGFGPGMRGTPWMAPMMPGMGRIDNIPNLTDKQKKEIADLRNQQMDDMKKFREENMAKMKSMMEEHRNKLMNILTDEQKKFISN